MIDQELYQRWLKSLFDHKQSDGDWYWDRSKAPVNILEQDFADYFILLCQNAKEDLKQYSNWKVGMGINYLFNPSIANEAFKIRVNKDIVKVQASILAIQNLYRYVFEPYCRPRLSHIEETGDKLNEICYMIWDISPLGYFEGEEEKDELYRVFAATLRFALYLNNPACIESALHGLGHLVMYYPQASQIIQDFIDSGHSDNEDLLEYAEAAKEGMIQ